MQLDAAATHQERMVMSHDGLDVVFGEGNLSLKSIKGDNWAPSILNINPADSILWGYLKKIDYSP